MGNQAHLRPRIQRRLCQGIPLFARGTIGNIAHRVNRFLRAAGSDHQPLASQLAFARQRLPYMSADFSGLQHAPHPAQTGCHASQRRTGKKHTALL